MISSCLWLRPSITISRDVITTLRKRSSGFGQMMTFAMPVSSSIVMNTTPLAEPGRCRTRTTPATPTQEPFFTLGKSLQESTRALRKSSRKNTIGWALSDTQRLVIVDDMLRERHLGQPHVRFIPYFARLAPGKEWQRRRIGERFTCHRAWRQSSPSERNASAAASFRASRRLRPRRSRDF